jgi:Fe-Mn family superoxide dismutase
MKFRLPALPWEEDGLEPFLSREAVEAHYYGHHKTYVEKVNQFVDKLALEGVSLEKLILNYDGAVYDNAAQAWNHTFYWLGLTPHSKTLGESSALLRSINTQFGSINGMKERFLEIAGNLFGSGWTWFVSNDSGEIDIVNTHNGDNPLRFEHSHPLWTCDVWEHAYYVDYRFKRKEYLNGAWDHINWEFVEECFHLKRIPNMSRLMLSDESHHAPLSGMLN